MARKPRVDPASPMTDAEHARAIAAYFEALDQGAGDDTTAPITYYRRGAPRGRVVRAGAEGEAGPVTDAGVRGDALGMTGDARLDIVCGDGHRQTHLGAVILSGGAAFVPRPDNPTMGEYAESTAGGWSTFWRPGTAEHPSKMVRRCPGCQRTVEVRWDRLATALAVLHAAGAGSRQRVDRRALTRILT